MSVPELTEETEHDYEDWELSSWLLMDSEALEVGVSPPDKISS